MTKMDPEYKAEWLKRLRSGEYEQGKRYLNKDDKFCCLGVLCEIGVERGILVSDSENGITEYRTVGSRNEGPPRAANLPGDFSHKLGLGGYPEPVVVRDDGDAVSLAVLNDMGMTFPKIADLIEEQL